MEKGEAVLTEEREAAGRLQIPFWLKSNLTVDEAAAYSGIGRNTIRRLIDWGKLPVLKVGRKTIIRRDTLEEFLKVNQGRNLMSEADVKSVV